MTLMGTMKVKPVQAAGGWTPANLPSLKLWYDCGDTATITQSGGLVSQIGNKALADWNLVQSEGNAQPTTGAETKNSLNVVNYDGSTDWTFVDGTAGAIATQPLTVALVVRYDTRTSNKHMTDGGSGGARILTSGDSNWRMYAGSNVLDSGVASDLNWHYMIFTFNAGGTSTIRKDGAEILSTSTTPGTDALNQSWHVGGNNADGTHMTLGELIVDDSALGGTDLSSLESYLAARWAI